MKASYKIYCVCGASVSIIVILIISSLQCLRMQFPIENVISSHSTRPNCMPQCGINCFDHKVFSEKNIRARGHSSVTFLFSDESFTNDRNNSNQTCAHHQFYRLAEMGSESSDALASKLMFRITSSFRLIYLFPPFNHHHYPVITKRFRFSIQ